MALRTFPDALLEKLKCSVCKLYLSMAPVSVKQDGRTLCRDCAYKLSVRSSEVISRCDIYEEIASLHAFPCRYQTLGCPQYKQFNQTERHESGCMHRTLSCPTFINSGCNWEDSVIMLRQHYETEHPELYLKDLNFELNINGDEEEHRLVQFDGILFLLQTKYAVKDGKMWFNVVYFGSTYNTSYIRYSIKLYGADEKQFVQLENKNPCPTAYMRLIPANSLEVDIHAVSSLLKHPEVIQSQWLITFSIPSGMMNQLKDQNEQDSRKLLCISNEAIKCPYCRCFATPPIFRCPLGHMTCINCKGFNNECIDCQLSNVEFSRAYDLEHLAKSARFYCKWKNCEKYFYCDQIRMHEQSCSERVYKCPCCEVRIGLFSEVAKHFQKKHIDVEFINEYSPCRFINLDIKDKDMYVLLQHEFVRVHLVGYNTAGHFYVKLVISHRIPPGFCNYFTCEVVNNRKCLEYTFNSPIPPYSVTEHIPKEKYAAGAAYFTIRLSINENKWIPFDYPFRNAKIENVNM